MRPIGIRDQDWSAGYGQTFVVDGLPLIGSWGGGSFTARATARVGQLMLHEGLRQDCRLLSTDAVRAVTRDVGTPHNGGIGWWSNNDGTMAKLPRDAYWGAGAGHQVVLVVPSLQLIAVRNGQALGADFNSAMEQQFFNPLMECIVNTMTAKKEPPYPPSPVIREIQWAPKDTIIRLAEGCDNWPLTWADDDALYGAYGDGNGFAPQLRDKLSLGLARVSGMPPDIRGENLPAPTLEAVGNDKLGRKASGLLCVDGILYLLARNVGNSQLAWSEDHGATWTWCDWKFTHSFGYPTTEQLLAVTKTGQTEYGMAAVGQGKATDGSRHLLAMADTSDDRPLWVSVWGGANTLAQALSDARRERSGSELKNLIAKLRIYTISDQDDSGSWLRREFPDLFYIVSPSTTDWMEYWRATWTGISGDRHYKNGPLHKFELVDNPWLEAHIINHHGPLGSFYPRLAYIMEGDTPSFLGLIRNGLGWSISPGYGGWGGRYALYQSYGETRPIWTNNQFSRDTVTADNGKTETSDPATIWRWREHFQHDFAARMDWCVADEYQKANHNPVATLNGDSSKRILELSAMPGQTIVLSAAGSNDPDRHPVSMNWFVYPEAGTFDGKVDLGSDRGESTSWVVPEFGTKTPKPATIHVILQVQDNGSPKLFAYRRAILRIEP